MNNIALTLNDNNMSTTTTTNNNNNKMKPLNEEEFRQLYLYEPPEQKSFFDSIKSNVKCTKNTAAKIFPIITWLSVYKKRDLMSDAIAGLTVGVMHIPQGMAYALLGGVPPVIGIYMAFFPVLVYIFMGTSHHVSMGTFAVVCMMVGKSVDQFGHSPEKNLNLNDLEHVHNETIALSPVDVATALCFVVGVWQVALSVFQLGSLSVLLSPTLVSGFTTGAAVHVFTSQIRNLLGIKVSRYSGPLKIIYSYKDVFTNLHDLNVAETILSASFIALLVIFNEFVRPFLQRKFKKTIPFPIELLVVVAGTLLSMYLDMNKNYGVAIIESVPKGLPDARLPPLDLLPQLVAEGLIIAIVAVSINISMASIFAQKMGYEIDGNQEILASGVGNIFSSFFSCMPYAASLSRSLVQVSVGGKTQMTSAVSAFFLLFILLFVGPYFEPLPYCVLSTIIVVALKGMFVQVKDVPEIYRKSKLEGFVWIVTFLSVVILDISYGLGVGLLASVSCLVLQSRKFEIVILGSVPGTNTYANVKLYKRAQYVNNILIVQLVGSLHFANSNQARKTLLFEFISFQKKMPPTLASEGKAITSHQQILVLDLSCVPYVDTSAVSAIKSVYGDLKINKCDLLISGCQPVVYKAFEKSDLFNELPKWLVFHELDDAVQQAKKICAQSKEQCDIYTKF